jgi:hypothetical protein
VVASTSNAVYFAQQRAEPCARRTVFSSISPFWLNERSGFRLRIPSEDPGDGGRRQKDLS